MLIIAAILKGEPIGIGHLLLNALIGIITRQTDQLFFPSLIIVICMRSGLRAAVDEPHLREKGLLDIPYLEKRFNLHQLKPKSASLEASKAAADAEEIPVEFRRSLRGCMRGKEGY